MSESLAVSMQLRRSQMDRGLFGTFDYDRDNLQPDPEREERDPDEWLFRGGQWIYVGDY